MFTKIDLAALRSRASHLRNGISCRIPQLEHEKATRHSVTGGVNYHITIAFEDGVSWIARIRRLNATTPPPIIHDYMVKNEVATLKFLEAVDIPTPRIYDYALAHDETNEMGVTYILMEKLPGKPLPRSLATEEQKERVVEKMADIFAELRKHPFPMMGALVEPGTEKMGAFARESLLDLQDSQIHGISPLTSWSGYHTSAINLVLDLIQRGEMYTNQPVDAYLVHRFLLELIPKVLPTDPSMNGQDGKFYLKHADDKGDHILVDDDFNITGIIDWEWAYTAPLSLAFISPIGFLDVAEFYDGKNSLTDAEINLSRLLREKRHDDLASAVDGGRLHHRLASCCGFNMDYDWSGFLGLFRGLRDLVDVDGGVDWDEWKVMALGRYGDDGGLKAILARENRPTEP